MTSTRLALDEESVDGVVVRTVAYYDNGTAVETVNGETGEPRPQTEQEQARFNRPPTDTERIDQLEAQLAAALAAIAAITD